MKPVVRILGPSGFANSFATLAPDGTGLALLTHEEAIAWAKRKAAELGVEIVDESLVSAASDAKVTPEMVRDALAKLGHPRDVIPACFHVMISQARAGGATQVRFVVSLLGYISQFWGEPLSVQELAYAIADFAEETSVERPLTAHERAMVDLIRGKVGSA